MSTEDNCILSIETIKEGCIYTMKNKKNSGRDYRHALSYTQKNFDSSTGISFQDSALNRSRFYKCSFNNISFKRAAVTGSVFENCTFNDCDLDLSDFEFCDFSGCCINTPHINDCSFNNSNFTKTTVKNCKFYECTFTNTFFEESVIDNVNITFSTLESACFSKCIFYNIDWRNINLEYVEFFNPCMTNAVLPSNQIPFMFGMLNYLNETNDKVKISVNGTLISIDDFFDKEIPKLIKNFEKRNIYLPISNICLFGKNKDYGKALDYLMREISDCSVNRDYRGIKFCCKLISMCEFDKRTLNQIYNTITKIGASLTPQSTEMKNFSRNIGEIRNMLFSNKHSKYLSIRLRANIGIESSERFAELIDRFQKMAKPFYNEMLNVKISLEYNSPLYIELKIEGNTSCFFVILRSFMIVAGIPLCECMDYPAVSAAASVSNASLYDKKALQYAEESFTALKDKGIEVSLLEYNFEGCDIALKSGERNFYMHPSMYNVLSRSLENVPT